MSGYRIAGALVGVIVGTAVGLGLCFLFWLSIGAPTAVDWTSAVGSLIVVGGAIAGGAIGERLGVRREAR